MQAFYKLSWIPSLITIVGLMFVASCKDDDAPPKATISFETAESELYENDGTIDVSIVLDRAASETIVLSYSLAGTADKLTSSGGDYDISPDGGSVTIAKGESEATIEIEAFEDDEFEVEDPLGEEPLTNETVIITITGIVSGPGQLGETALTHTVNILEDDMLVLLDWDRPGGEDDDVDMDLFIWANDPGDDIEEYQIIGASNQEGNAFEYFIIPGGLPDWDLGFSYVYYSGTNEDLDFGSLFINYGGSVNGNAAGIITEANYSLANINAYDPQTLEPIPQMVQTVSKSGLDYVDLTEITVPESGSRQKLLLGSLAGADLSTLRKGAPQLRKISLPLGYVEKLKRFRK